MEYPVVVVLSGPEKTRAKAELALEKARLTIIPPKEWPIQRESYAAEHWPHISPYPMVRLPDKDEYVPAPFVNTDDEWGHIAVLAETEALFHVAYQCVEKHKWVLRQHYELPEKPKPHPMVELFDNLTARLDRQERMIADLIRANGGLPPVAGAGFETGAGEFMQSGSYSAPQLRRSVFGWAARATSTVGSAVANTPGAIAGGLFSTADMQLTAAASGLVVYTSTGECLIPGQEAANQGGYHAFLSSQNSTTLATANGTNPRIDIICATCGDSSYTLPSGGTSGQVTIQAVTGTPTAGATLTNLSGAPSLPLSSLLLGYVLVPASATNITNANIANKATASGIPVQSFNGRTGAVTPQNGDYGISQITGISRGTVSLTFSSSATATAASVTHGLNGTPAAVVFGWEQTLSQNITPYVGTGTINSSTFAMSAVAVSAFTGTILVAWMAML